MNQMLQEPEVTSPEVKSPETIDRPPATAHPRFAKPQRVAFVLCEVEQRTSVEVSAIATVRKTRTAPMIATPWNDSPSKVTAKNTPKTGIKLMAIAAMPT